MYLQNKIINSCIATDLETNIWNKENKKKSADKPTTAKIGQNHIQFNGNQIQIQEREWNKTCFIKLLLLLKLFIYREKCMVKYI